MRFAQIDNGKVTLIVDDSAYTILPPNCIQLTKTFIVKPGDIYEAGSFRIETLDDIQKEFRPVFNKERERLFESTKWIRERHQDRIELVIDDSKNWDEWLIYWQALRDMPQQIDFDALYPKWPEQPVE